MSKRKKINKFKVIIAIFMLLVFFMSVTGLGRFVYNATRDRYLASKKFYFSSNLLNTNNDTYNYTNWDGNGVYKINIEMYSKNNDTEAYNDDLKYSLVISYDSSNILCALDPAEFKTSTGSNTTDYYTKENDGDNRKIIPAGTNTSNFTLYVKPNVGKTLQIGQTHNIKVKAYTSEPYKKTIEATFALKICELAYTIEDENKRPYVIMNVRNIYDCDSIVTININPEYVRLDLNDSVCTESDTIMTNDINNNIKSITFTMGKETSRDIKFYKKNDNNGLISSFGSLSTIFSLKRIEKIE